MGTFFMVDSRGLIIMAMCNIASHNKEWEEITKSTHFHVHIVMVICWIARGHEQEEGTSLVTS